MKHTAVLLSLSSYLLIGACNADEVLTDFVNNTTQIDISRADHPDIQYKLTLVERPDKSPRWRYMIVVDGKCTSTGCEEALLTAKGYLEDDDRAPWNQLLADAQVATQACQLKAAAEAEPTGRVCKGDIMTVSHTEDSYTFDATSSLVSLVDLRALLSQLYRDASPIDDGVKNPLGSDEVPYPLP